MSCISGLYAVTPDEDDTQALLGMVGAALAGGARLLQYRNKAAAPELRRMQAMALRDLCRTHGAILIINDHADVAREIGADGVHVGEDDAAIAQARAILGQRGIIGASCYNRLERARLAHAQGADYVAFGSFFPSSVKPGAVRASLELLAAARRQIKLPIVAIGGITLANAPQLVSAGADAVAVISALFGTRDVQAAARSFTSVIAEAKA